MTENNGRDRTEDHGHRDGKKLMANFLLENFQWIGIILAVLLGIRKPPEAGEKGPNGKEPPRWVYNLFSFIFTIDEQKYVHLLNDSALNQTQRTAFFKFKNAAVAEKFDEDYLRLMLVNLYQDWLDRKDAKLTDIPKSAIILVEHIASLDGDYAAQKEFAEEMKLLKKVGPLKKAYLWHQSHKLETIVGFFLIPWAIYQIILWLLGA
jgi:hypothetical protein